MAEKFLLKRFLSPHINGFVVGISKTDRDKLGVKVHDIVKLKSGDKTEIAVVVPIERDLLNYSKPASVGMVLVAKLGLDINTHVEISKDVTAEEKKGFNSQKAYEERIKAEVRNNPTFARRMAEQAEKIRGWLANDDTDTVENNSTTG